MLAAYVSRTNPWWFTSPLPPMPAHAGSLARGKPSQRLFFLSFDAKAKGHLVYASVSSWVQIGIMIPFEVAHWVIVRIK